MKRGTDHSRKVSYLASVALSADHTGSKRYLSQARHTQAVVAVERQQQDREEQVEKGRLQSIMSSYRNAKDNKLLPAIARSPSRTGKALESAGAKLARLDQ